MRKIVTCLLLSTLVGSTSLSAFGQNAVCFYRAKSLKIRKAPDAPVRPADQYAVNGMRRVAPKTDYADFEKAKAGTVRKAKGVVVEWEMAEERGNLGFFVYRNDVNGKELISPEITVGSAGLVRDQPLYGQVYRVYDPKGRRDTTYIIEALGPQGERVSTDPISVGDEPSTVDASKIERKSPPANLETVSSAEGALGTSDVSESQLSDLATQRWVVGQPGAKIAVRAEGLYRVRLSELQSAIHGVFTASNTANWRLFKEGVEQAIIVGSDGSGPYLEFYGKPIDTRESDTRIYYLIADASNAGLRMARQKTLPAGTNSTSYPAVVEKKERITYVGTMFNGDLENWWGRPITSTPSSPVTVTLSGIDTSQPTATVTVKIQGWSLTPNKPSVRVTLNGTFLGNMSTEDYQVPFSANFTVPTSLLVEGTNNLGLTSNFGSNTELFDTVQISYARKYDAIQNGLGFSVPMGQRSVINKFASPNVRAFSLKNEDRPVWIGGLSVQQSGATYSATIPALPRGISQKVFAVENSGLLTASSVTVNVPSNLSSTTPNADMIIISYSAPDFMAAAQAWANYRRGQGFSVQVVDIADILDEYSYGSLSSTAVRDFLQYAHANWPTQVPDKQYVLLLGDGSTDPRNYTGYGYYDQVPTMMVTTVYQETGSDEALADFDGDGLAEMSVGRIPFRTGADVTRAFNKTVTFESTPSLQSLNRGALFSYDLPNGYDFEAMSHDLASYLPASVPKDYIGRMAPPPPAPPDCAAPQICDQNHAALLAAINSGKYLVNYSGHGAQSIWATTTFFANSSVNSELTNSANPSIYTMLTCLNGYFIGHNGLNDDSIAELLVKSPTGGGPAAWASTGLTTADVQMMMGRRFVEQIGLGNIPRMGDLIRDAKGVIPAGADVRFSWALFGDPMLKVR